MIHHPRLLGRISLRLGLPACLAVLALGSLPVSAAAPSPYTQWPMGGQNVLNSRSNPFETSISAQNATALAQKWVARTHGDVSATPAVVGGYVYVPDWGSGTGGYLNKFDTNGHPIWSYPISGYDGVSGAVSRTSPAVVGNTIYIGDQNGANLMSIDATTGTLNWIHKLDTGPFAIDTQSPVVYNGVVYVGVASSEEGVVAFIPGYQCCKFRGAMVALNAANGAQLWKTYTISDADWNAGYSGASIWGSTPAIDPVRNSVYITTGNNYSSPSSCTSPCDPKDNHVDSIMALDLNTGTIKWATGLLAFDTWNVACIQGINPGGCPSPAGPDYDFGSGANIFVAQTSTGTKTLVGAGEKSGDYWALNADDGSIAWGRKVGPGSTLGGIEWGTATDSKRIYVAEANYDFESYTLPNGQTTTAGSWAALDPATGSILWQTPAPDGGRAEGAVSTANGVVYAGSLNQSAGTSHFYALAATTGTVLWGVAPEGSVNAGPAITNGVVYWGNGYSRFGLGAGSTSFYAFSLGGM